MNRLIAYLVTLGIFLVVFLLVVEGGLRLLGFSPQPTINEFHPRLGWVKLRDSSATRSTSEFSVTYRINALGLRDDEDLTVEKPQGTERVLVLGDSFTLGYTVDRADLFVDLLEAKLAAEDRAKPVQVVNAGTEGYSSDQELLWLREEGLKFNPDVVVMCFYENDVFWNSQDHYARFPKPLFPAEGAAEAPLNPELEDPGKQGWFTRATALGKLVSGISDPPPSFKTKGGVTLYKELGVLLNDEPDFMSKAWTHTEAVMRGFKETCEARKIKPLLALIPTKAQIYTEFRDLQQQALGLDASEWNPNLPFKRITAICRDVGLDFYDPTQLLLDEAGKGMALYYTKDRHFSPEGNRAFAQGLWYKLIDDRYLGKPRGEFDAAIASGAAPTMPAAGPSGFPTWLTVVLILWAVLGLLYVLNYRDENGVAAFLKVGALIWTVVGLITLINLLVEVLPHGAGGAVVGLIVLGILLFLAFKLRKRFGIITELYIDFTNRGHWYMMPLLAVMLAIGSLLIVAASSPFVAPFIYTLF
jgi:hypothetical protein